jgi:glucuronosyltransferase
MRILQFISVFLGVASCIELTTCANILFFFGVGTYSHRITVWPLVEALVERGHNVTFLSSFPPKVPNPKVHEIVLPSTNRLEWPKFVDLRLTGVFRDVWLGLPTVAMKNCEAITSNLEIKAWAESSTYDLVVIDSLFNECGLGLVWKFQSKYILFATTSAYMWHHEMFGFPAETSWLPDMHLAHPLKMSFFEKVKNTLAPIAWYFGRHWFFFPKLEALLKEGFNIPDMPPLSQLERESMLILLNSHYSLDYPRSFPPMVVPIGGLQVKNSTEPLPKVRMPESLLYCLFKKILVGKFRHFRFFVLFQDMDEFIQGNGDQGFIYVSLGSSAKSTDFPDALKDVFFHTFGNSSVRFLWKWESEVPKEMPKNVFTSDWMPQQDILGTNMQITQSHSA